MLFLPENDTQTWQRCFVRAMEGKEVMLEKHYYIEEKEAYDLIKIVPLYDSNQNVIGCIYHAEDILPLKKSEKVLLDERKKYITLFDNNLAGIAVTDAQLNFIHCNNAMRQITKISKEEINRINANDFFISDNSNICKKLEKIKRGDLSQFTVFEKFKNKLGIEIYGHLALSGVYKNDVFTGCVMTLVDISSQKEVEELKLKEELNILKQDQLAQELDFKNRELYANLVLISKQNTFLKELEKELKKVIKSSNDDAKQKLNKITAMIRSNRTFEDNWGKSKIHFEKIHPNFFEKLRNHCPELTEKELRHCAYIKIGLSNKEASQLLNVMPKTIEMARYRIKKKFKMDKTQNLANLFNEM